MQQPRLVIARPALPRILAGHPWLYREAVKGSAETGAVVVLEDGSGHVVGRGVFDAGSPLAVRMWTRGDAPLDVPGRLASALALRGRLFDEATTAYRLVHGEGDRLPGLVIDRYGPTAVLRTDGDAAALVYAAHAATFERQLRDLGIETLLHKRIASRKTEASAPPEVGWGPAPTGPVEVREHGMAFVADLLRGQKTGAFLDQRDNRRRVGELARGRRVLNLFSYAGGFSQAAALGGAPRVTSVDVAHEAHGTAQRSFKLAGLDPSAHAFVTADAFQWLESTKERFDLVVSDPPSFAPNEKSLPKALAAYRRLHRACARVLGAGRDLLRRFVLQPRRRENVPRHARRRGARRPRAPGDRAARRAPRSPGVAGVSGRRVPQVHGADLSRVRGARSSS